jgi:hypothetical protein
MVETVFNEVASQLSKSSCFVTLVSTVVSKIVHLPMQDLDMYGRVMG